MAAGEILNELASLMVEYGHASPSTRASIEEAMSELRHMLWAEPTAPEVPPTVIVRRT